MFPVCKLISGLRRSGDAEIHHDSEYFWKLRDKWKKEGLLRGLGNIRIEGLEGMPAPVMNLADLAHLTIEGLGVSCNTVHQGEERYARWMEELQGMDIDPQIYQGLKRLAAREDYINFMIRRLIALVCVDKGSGDQVKHFSEQIGENASIGEPGTPDLGKTRNSSNLVLKRCRIMLAWGMAAIFEELLKERASEDPDLKIIRDWLKDVKEKDLTVKYKDEDIYSKKRKEFIMGDIPVDKIRKKIEIILSLFNNNGYMQISSLPKSKLYSGKVSNDIKNEIGKLIKANIIKTKSRMEDFIEIIKDVQ